MFEKKKLWMALAASTLVAACGGGSDGGSPSPGGNDDTSGGDVVSANDSPLTRSYLQMHTEDQILVNALLPLSAYESDEADGGLWGQAKGTNADGENNGAPFETFGLRIDNAAQFVEGAATDEESATGRLAISLAERDESVQGGAGEVAESMQIMMTGITLTAEEGTGTVSVSQADDATMYVSGTAANGDVVENVAVDIPAGVVSLVPVADLPNGEEDPGSIGLVFNVDAAFDAATAEQAAELAKLADLSGRFSMNFAFSAADVYRAGEAGAAATQLDDQSISVEGNDMEAVVGSGIPGNIWIDYTHPNQP